jgi:hypothetical protein
MRPTFDVLGPVENEGLRRQRQKGNREQKDFSQSEKVSNDGVGFEGPEGGAGKVFIAGVVVERKGEHRGGQGVNESLQEKPLQKDRDEKINPSQVVRVRESDAPQKFLFGFRRKDQQSGGSDDLENEIQENRNEQVGASQKHRTFNDAAP